MVIILPCSRFRDSDRSKNTTLNGNPTNSGAGAFPSSGSVSCSFLSIYPCTSRTHFVMFFLKNWAVTCSFSGVLYDWFTKKHTLSKAIQCVMLSVTIAANKFRQLTETLRQFGLRKDAQNPNCCRLHAWLIGIPVLRK